MFHSVTKSFSKTFSAKDLLKAELKADLNIIISQFGSREHILLRELASIQL